MASYATTSAARLSTGNENTDRFDMEQIFKNSEDVLDVKQTKLGYDIFTRHGTYKLRRKKTKDSNKIVRFMEKIFKKKTPDTDERPQRRQQAPIGIYGFYNDVPQNHAMYVNNQHDHDLAVEGTPLNNYADDFDVVYEPCPKGVKVSSKAPRQSPPTLPRRNTVSSTDLINNNGLQRRDSYMSLYGETRTDYEVLDLVHVQEDSATGARSTFNHLLENTPEPCGDSSDVEELYPPLNYSGRNFSVNKNFSSDCRTTDGSHRDSVQPRADDVTASLSVREERIRNLYRKIKSSSGLLPGKGQEVECLYQTSVSHDEGQEISRDDAKYSDEIYLPMHPAKQFDKGASSSPIVPASRDSVLSLTEYEVVAQLQEQTTSRKSNSSLLFNRTPEEGDKSDNPNDLHTEREEGASTSNLQTQVEKLYDGTPLSNSGRNISVNKDWSLNDKCQSIDGSELGSVRPCVDDAAPASLDREERIRNLYRNIKSSSKLLPGKEQGAKSFCQTSVFHDEDGTSADDAGYLNPIHQTGQIVKSAPSSPTLTTSRGTVINTGQPVSRAPSSVIRTPSCDLGKPITCTSSSTTTTLTESLKRVIPVSRAASSVTMTPPRDLANSIYKPITCASSPTTTLTESRDPADRVDKLITRASSAYSTASPGASCRRESTFHELYAKVPSKIKSSSTICGSYNAQRRT